MNSKNIAKNVFLGIFHNFIIKSWLNLFSTSLRNDYFNILVVAVLNSYDQVFIEDW
jgi:hypothetical protein